VRDHGDQSLSFRQRLLQVDVGATELQVGRFQLTRISLHDSLLLIGELRHRMHGDFTEKLLHQGGGGGDDRATEAGIYIAKAQHDPAADATKHFQLADQLIDLVTVGPADFAVGLGIGLRVLHQHGGVARPQERTALLINLGQVIEQLLMSEAVGRRDLRIPAYRHQPLVGGSGPLRFEIVCEIRQAEAPKFGISSRAL
jgi:hypothetical protein